MTWLQAHVIDLATTQSGDEEQKTTTMWPPSLAVLAVATAYTGLDADCSDASDYSWSITATPFEGATAYRTSGSGSLVAISNQ